MGAEPKYQPDENGYVDLLYSLDPKRLTDGIRAFMVGLGINLSRTYYNDVLRKIDEQVGNGQDRFSETLRVYKGGAYDLTLVGRRLGSKLNKEYATLLRIGPDEDGPIAEEKIDILTKSINQQ